MPASLSPVDPYQARDLLDAGALVVDIREPHEVARGSIPGSTNVALSGWARADLQLREGQAVVFLCASGTRTSVNAPALAEKAGSAPAYVLRGGILAWQKSGLPLE